MAVYDAGYQDDWQFLVMEYIPGENLRDLLSRGGKALPVDEALFVINGILQALDFAHGLDIIHRDIKPQNVMVVILILDVLTLRRSSKENKVIALQVLRQQIRILERRVGKSVRP